MDGVTLTLGVILAASIIHQKINERVDKAEHERQKRKEVKAILREKNTQFDKVYGPDKMRMSKKR